MINVKRFRQLRNPYVFMLFSWRQRRLLRRIWDRFYQRLVDDAHTGQMAALVRNTYDYFSHVRVEEWIQSLERADAPDFVIALEPKRFWLRFWRKTAVVQLYVTHVADEHKLRAVGKLGEDYINRVAKDAAVEDKMLSLSMKQTRYFKDWHPYFLWEMFCRAVEMLPDAIPISRECPHHFGIQPEELSGKNLPFFRSTYLIDDHFVEIVIGPI